MIARVALIAMLALAAAASPDDAKDEGLPIASRLVQTKCAGCHTIDDQQRMTRISYRRASPENWERTVKRMVSLNKVALDPADARKIVKYLSDHHGLAPEEARPMAFEAEHRTIDYTYDADKDTANTCASCHSLGRVFTERRTKEEWGLLLSMHRGYYPLVDNQPMNGGQGFRRTRAPQTEPGADGRAPDNRHPMDRIIEYLAKAYPLSTPEWTEWSAAAQPVNVAGRWALSGYAAGKGPLYGEVVITAEPGGDDVFTTETRYTFARTGESIARKGKATIYTGFQWRGRSSAAAASAPAPTSSGSGSGPSGKGASDDDGGAATVAVPRTSTGASGGTAAAAAGDVWRETLFIERTRKEMGGRWFTGAYDETGLDVKLVKVTNDPVVLGLSVTALRCGSAARALKIFGAHLPARLTPQDITLGPGISISRVHSATPDAVVVDVEVAANAQPGPRDIAVAGVLQPDAVMVYDKVDGIKILPRAGMARNGGLVYPKQLQQFEAVAVHNGPDGKPNTKDDWSLGLVDVKWRLDEYTATFGDDDLAYVGTLDAAGLFTPNVDGPNPKRSGERNNVGDVWVVGELAPNAAMGTTKPLRARAHLLVTVPVYMGWTSPSEASR